MPVETSKPPITARPSGACISLPASRANDIGIMEEAPLDPRKYVAILSHLFGGAVMGNQVEGNMHAYHSYEIRVRLDDGSLRTFHQRSIPAWRNGDRVRIVKGTLHSA